ncbi:MAG: hypothetical protein WBW27_01925 [Pseudolabrys sp.]|jgi:hypothetical protein
MIAMVIIEPTLEFSTSGLTRPSREQKIAMEMTTNAAPETVRNISHFHPLCGTKVMHGYRIIGTKFSGSGVKAG